LQTPFGEIHPECTAELDKKAERLLQQRVNYQTQSSHQLLYDLFEFTILRLNGSPLNGEEDRRGFLDQPRVFCPELKAENVFEIIHMNKMRLVMPLCLS